MWLHGARIRVWFCVGTVLWIILVGAASVLWFNSYDWMIACVYDPRTKLEWCAYRGAIYTWHYTYVPPAETWFDLFSISAAEAVRHATYRMPLWIPMLIVTASWPAVLGFLVAYRSWRTQRRRRAGCCVNCAYSLEGNESGVCPECAHPVPCVTPHSGGATGGMPGP